MHRSPPPREVPDYTAAALAMGLVNLLWILAAIWAWLGFPVVLLVGYALNLAIDRLAARG